MKKISLVSLIVLSCVGVLSIFYFLQKDLQITTSLDAGNIATPFPSPEIQSSSPTLSLLFTGDTMLDRNIRLKAQQNGYDFLIGPRLKELLSSADYTMTNLEGPVTNNPSTSVGSEVGSSRNFIFTFDPQSLDFLKNHNITLVNLGNNHILNFGEEGLSETYQHLEQAEMLYFGYTGTSPNQYDSTLILHTEQGTLGFVNYNQFISGGEERAFQDLASIKNNVDYVVVYTHWGNEYVQENQVLIDLAHRFVDEGADLIIGSHPHVITGHEVYKDKHIYYSLGNFIFDQYFDAEVKKGLVVLATINPKTRETSVTEHTVFIEPTGQTELE